MKVGNVWYSPGLSATEGSIWKSSDDGATWPDLVMGYYWASPPNKAFMNKNVTTLAATAKYIIGRKIQESRLADVEPRADSLRKAVEYRMAKLGLLTGKKRKKPAICCPAASPRRWAASGLAGKAIRPT